MKNKPLYKIFIFVIFISCLRAQSPLGIETHFNTLSNLDTLITKKMYGDWWIGTTSGTSLNLFYGTLNILRNPYQPKDKTILNFDKKITLNGFLGLLFEWNPPGKKYCGIFNLTFLDYRTIMGSATNNNDPQNNYKTYISYNYLTFAPYIKYNLPVENLHLLGSIGCDMLFTGINNSFGSKAQIIRELKSNTGVQIPFNIPGDPVKLRYSMNVGIGYDIYVMEMYRVLRVKLTPFFTIGIGSKIIDIYSSTTSQLIARAGFQLKFGPEKVLSNEILPFDKSSIKKSTDISGNIKNNKFSINNPSDLKFDSKNLDSRYSDITDTIAVLEQKKKDTLLQAATLEASGYKPEEDSTVVVLLNNPKEYYYSSNDKNVLTSALKDLLDKYADMVLKDKKLAIRVWGYSDDQGTTIENEQRAEARTKQVCDYLMKIKKVNFFQILPKSLGARDPKYDNRTKIGQKLNRRVVVTLVPLPK